MKQRDETKHNQIRHAKTIRRALPPGPWTGTQTNKTRPRTKATQCLHINVQSNKMLCAHTHVQDTMHCRTSHKETHRLCRPFSRQQQANWRSLRSGRIDRVGLKQGSPMWASSEDQPCRPACTDLILYLIPEGEVWNALTVTDAQTQ